MANTIENLLSRNLLKSWRARCGETPFRDSSALAEDGAFADPYVDPKVTLARTIATTHIRRSVRGSVRRGRGAGVAQVSAATHHRGRGFRCGWVGPFGRMMAEEVCGGRIVMTHEGGYSAASVPFFGLAVLETLSGISTGVQDPFQPLIDGFGQQELQPHQDAAIRLAEELLDGLPLT